jgi:tetratricopeptide (TPR) repeat protein
MKSRIARLVGPALAATLLLGTSTALAIAQGRIQGTVTDGTGKPIPDVKVVITTKELVKFRMETKTNKDGHWAAIVGDATKKYIYHFEKADYIPYEEEKKIGIGSNETWDIKLLTKEQAIQTGAVEVKVDPFVETYNAAVELFRADDLAGALAKAEEAVKIAPEKGTGYDLAAKIAHKSKNWDKVIEFGEKALTIEPDNVALYPVLMDAYRAKGDKAKLAEYEKKFAAANPENPDILYNQAVDLYNRNDFKGAEPILRKVVEIKPDFAKAQFLLGMTCVNTNKIDDMKKHLQEYIKLDPKGADVGTAREMLDAFK